MSLDPTARSLLLWETLEPSPPPRPETRRTDPRIVRARRTVKALYALAPRIATAHYFDADSPEECNSLLAHGFTAGFIGFMYDVPSYVQWLGRQDLTGIYRYLRCQLQYLSWHDSQDHWALAYEWDIVLRGPDATPVDEEH